MTSYNQLQAVQQEISKVGAEIDKAKGELVTAKAESGIKEMDFLRNTLVELRKEKIELLRQKNILLEQETILLRAQAPGQHCLPSSELNKNAYTCSVWDSNPGLFSERIAAFVLKPAKIPTIHSYWIYVTMLQQVSACNAVSMQNS